MNTARPRRVSLIIAGATSGHSVSNHRRDDRRSSGCQRIYARPDRLRQSLEGSPVHTDRIEFTATTHAGRLCYGLVVLVPVLSTPPRGDAVTVRYRTVLHRTEADFHGSIPSPSQAHERGLQAAEAWTLYRASEFPDCAIDSPNGERWYPFGLGGTVAAGGRFCGLKAALLSPSLHSCG